VVVGTFTGRHFEKEEFTMSTITCKHCGLSFETEARTNTRCRRCRAVLSIPSEQRSPKVPYVLALRLACGHVTTAVGENIEADSADDYEWPCPDCGLGYREAVGVLGALTEAESAAMSQQAADAWLTAHSTDGAVTGSYPHG